MNDKYISVSKFKQSLAKLTVEGGDKKYAEAIARTLSEVVPHLLDDSPAADVQPVKCCRMIPLEPDCRGYTDVFICTNCHQHIHLGFIRKEYSGSYCLECGAEVKDGDTE
jgi:hypothetical protein